MRISDWSSDVCSSDLILKSSLSRSRGEDLDGSSPPQNRRLADNPFSPTACLTQRNIWGAAPLVGQEARPYASGKTRRYPMGEFTEKAKGLGNEAAGNAKQATGKATDNERLRAEGEAQERKGEAKNLKGKVQGALGDKS